MQAGLLRETVTVRRNSGNASAYGDVGDDWRDVCTVRAQVTVQNGRRALSRGEVWYPRAVVVRVRRGTDVTNVDRIVWNSETYDIISVTEDVRDNSITVNAELHND